MLSKIFFLVESEAFEHIRVAVVWIVVIVVVRVLSVFIAVSEHSKDSATFLTRSFVIHLLWIRLRHAIDRLFSEEFNVQSK